MPIRFFFIVLTKKNKSRKEQILIRCPLQEQMFEAELDTLNFTKKKNIFLFQHTRHF